MVTFIEMDSVIYIYIYIPADIITLHLTNRLYLLVSYDSQTKQHEPVYLCNGDFFLGG
jgi:hypothetical protein